MIRLNLVVYRLQCAQIGPDQMAETSSRVAWTDELKRAGPGQGVSHHVRYLERAGKPYRFEGQGDRSHNEPAG